ncbi:MAG TPA: ribosome-associated translation inhibitor RaiA [Patescibacteria group bacterium]|nr:ribosome-associated translation inhibitor RaiA [Patescibacteria group bacterium]
MDLTVKGMHLDVGDSLREHVRANLTHTAGKYFREPIKAVVVFTKEKNHRYTADISIHAGHGIVLEAQNEADDPYPAFDGASKNVAKRLSKYKDRLKDHHKRQGVSETTAAAYTTFSSSNENEAEGGQEPAVIAEMDTQVPTLAVADAVLRLELGTAPALLFRNPKHSGLNMVYRRKDGNIGWVDPEGSAPAKKPATAAKPVAKPAAKPAAKAAPAKAAAKPAARHKPAQKKKAKAGKKRR